MKAPPPPPAKDAGGSDAKATKEAEAVVGAEAVQDQGSIPIVAAA
ncbi:hypothetical protein KP509_36G039600 [Ceratopteris richardii]|nr:hypothetical protein KP509_36G039600 [Ceratopteris richardii]